MTNTKVKGAENLSTLVLSNKFVTIEFSDTDEYCLQGVKLSNGRTVTLPDKERPWSLKVVPGMESPANILYKGGEKIGDDRIELSWTYANRRGLSEVIVSVQLKENSPLPEWTMKVSGAGVSMIDQITFPRFQIHRKDEMELIMPVGYGIAVPIKNDTQAFTEYPSGSGTMQLLMATFATGTAFITTKDYDAQPKQFRCMADEEKVSLFVTTTVSEEWLDGDRLELPWTTLFGFKESGWEETAIEWYRPFTFETAWGQKTVEERDLPEWLLANDLWIQKQESDSYIDLLNSMALYGNDVGIHWYHWHHYPFDTRYPDYFPARGATKEEFSELANMGAKIVPYINGRIWDPLSQAYETYDGAEGCCTKRDGSYYEESYISKVPHYVACPASEQWRTVQSDVVNDIINTLATSGVYVDQVACAAPVPCHNEAHGHKKGGGKWWADGYRKIYSLARERSICADQILMTEECAECYIDIFDLMLIVNTDRRGDKRPIPLFPVVYSDRALYTGFCYIGSPINDGSYNYITAKSLLWGTQLGWIQPGMIMNEDARREALFLKKMQLFRAQHRYIFGGGCLLSEWTPSEIGYSEVPGHGVQPLVLGAKWLSIEGSTHLVLVNRDDTEHNIVLPNGEEVVLRPLTPYIFDLND
ncbi:MAG: DUF6259 domain-containing protein [Porphyromonas sp.]|nr:DUF6259 domain-containing protein [Porphyromonas sp.]